MTIFQSFLFLAVSFSASIIGAICGVGGGVIMKPVLDLFGWVSVSAISFLSSCTVLSMSCYSVGKSMLAKDSRVDLKTGTPLAIGAAFGGAVGKQMFTTIKSVLSNPELIGAVQSICLMIITIGTLVYTVKKDSIPAKRITSPLPCILIGLVLGVCSSFLGIGGGPINLVVLFFFFSMDTKTAADNSLYIILFSQITSLLMTLFTNSVPDFTLITLIFMVLGGILGAMCGRVINKKIDNKIVSRLFIGLMIVIICISAYNTWTYSSVWH